MLYAELTEKVIGCAMKVHRVLGPGFLESVYQNALALELQRAGVTVELERPHEVQPVNYLTVTGIEIGLLLDFGAQSPVNPV